MTTSLRDRVFSKTQPVHSGCLEWTGCVDKNGYARVQVDGKFKIASRVMWQLEHGAYPEKHLCVCHTCDNPKCVNPKHLWLGTPKDNFEDAVKKGRRARTPNVLPENRRRGNSHPKTKLTEKQVREIKQRLNEGETGFYREYGVTKYVIYNIKAGRTWGHIDI